MSEDTPTCWRVRNGNTEPPGAATTVLNHALLLITEAARYAAAAVGRERSRRIRRGRCAGDGPGLGRDRDAVADC